MLVNHTKEHQTYTREEEEDGSYLEEVLTARSRSVEVTTGLAREALFIGRRGPDLDLAS